jgi:hypothetical protein
MGGKIYTMNYILRKTSIYPVVSTFIAALLVSIVSVEIYWHLNSEEEISQTQATVADSKKSEPATDSTVEVVRSEPEILPEIEKNFAEDTRDSIAGIDPEMALLLESSNFGQLRERLLQLASVAVSEDDMNRLAYILNLLGQISIQEQDLHSARVYLTESLDIFQSLNDEIGSAQIYLQLGRTHLKSRQIARVAGTAYDELQVGRWYLEKGLYDVAEKYISRSIDKNMSINRFGSAASAFESLARMASQKSDLEQLEKSVVKAARLFAASGKVYRARKVLELLPEEISEKNSQLAILKIDIDNQHEEYKNNILQIERARDYRRLYHYYRNQGDKERAWKFRLLANSSLADVSKRALFHRQQGVLAILYNSNESMDLAEKYFVQAKETFDFNGLQELADETDQLNKQIF